MLKKKLTVLFIAAAMCLSAVPVCAADAGITAANNTVQAVTKSQTFTIDEAIEYAKQNSRTIAACKASESLAKAQKEEAKKASRDVREQIFGSEYGASSDSTYLILTGYTYRAAVFGYAVAQRSSIQQEYILEADVKSTFYAYLNSVELADIAKSSLDSANERVTYAEVKYKNGTISALELEEFKLAALEAEKTYNTAVRTKDLNMMKLKSVLNYPQEDELIVTGSFERQEMDTTTPEEAFAKSANSISMVNLNETLELAKLKLDKSIAHYTSNSVGARTAKAEYAQAELDYYNSVETLRINLYSAYNSMADAYEELKYADQSLASIEKSVDVVKRQYELGLVTSEDYLECVQLYDRTKNLMVSAELGAYLTTVQYKLCYDIQNTISQEDASL